jgi:hypothetical protein
VAKWRRRRNEKRAKSECKKSSTKMPVQMIFVPLSK